MFSSLIGLYEILCTCFDITFKKACTRQFSKKGNTQYKTVPGKPSGLLLEDMESAVRSAESMSHAEQGAHIPP